MPNPGDFVVSRMGEEEVILVRDRKNKLHVFLNTCRHRGMKVCRYDDGNTLVFTCPFHGWSYDTDGRLVGVPYYDAAYHGEIDKRRVGPARGRPDVQLLRLDLGDVGQEGAVVRGVSRARTRPSVRRCFQSSDGEDNGVEVFNPIYKWRIPTNWKFPGFSFDGDSAHGAMTHRSINVAAIGPQGEAGGGDRHGLRASLPVHVVRDVDSRTRPRRPQPRLRPAGRAALRRYVVDGAGRG